MFFLLTVFNCFGITASTRIFNGFNLSRALTIIKRIAKKNHTIKYSMRKCIAEPQQHHTWFVNSCENLETHIPSYIFFLLCPTFCDHYSFTEKYKQNKQLSKRWAWLKWLLSINGNNHTFFFVREGCFYFVPWTQFIPYWPKFSTFFFFLPWQSNKKTHLFK